MTKLATSKNDTRKRRHARVRAKISGTTERPRLAVYRSNRFVSVQLIDDTKGHTIAQAHGREFKGAQSAQAAAVGKAIAERAKKAGVSAVVFDRGGYAYAAQVQALATAAREGGLTF
jgi:large subunit ribosomal protein L18